MKNLILISTLLAAGTLAANAATPPTGTYEDEKGNKQDFEFVEVYNTGEYSYYALSLTSEIYKDVSISSNNTVFSITLAIDSNVTFNGFTFNGVQGAGFNANAGSVLGGEIKFSNVEGSYIYSELSSRTHFSIDSNSTVYFHSNIWNIAEADLTKPLVEGKGKIGMDSNATFTLNFLSEKLLKEQKICLVLSEMTVDRDYPRFKNIAITLNGNAVRDYMATQSKDGRTISISRAVPEPSLFGLVAGTLALVLAGTRRRRK